MQAALHAPLTQVCTPALQTPFGDGARRARVAGLGVAGLLGGLTRRVARARGIGAADLAVAVAIDGAVAAEADATRTRRSDVTGANAARIRALNGGI